MTILFYSKLHYTSPSSLFFHVFWHVKHLYLLHIFVFQLKGERKCDREILCLSFLSSATNHMFPLRSRYSPVSFVLLLIIFCCCCECRFLVLWVLSRGWFMPAWHTNLVMVSTIIKHSEVCINTMKFPHVQMCAGRFSRSHTINEYSYSDINFIVSYFCSNLSVSILISVTERRWLKIMSILAHIRRLSEQLLNLVW